MKSIGYPVKSIDMGIVEVDETLAYKTKVEAEKALADLNDLASELSLPLDVKIVFIPFQEECFYLVYNYNDDLSLVAIERVLEARARKEK